MNGVKRGNRTCFGLKSHSHFLVYFDCASYSFYRNCEVFFFYFPGDFGGSESERQAAKSAQNFLLTDEILRHKLSRDT